MRETILIPAAIAALLLLAIAAKADNEPKYYHSSKEITKVEALRLLINDPKADVAKCSPQEVSDKATLRNRKIKK